MCHSVLALLTAQGEQGQTQKQLFHETGALRWIQWKLNETRDKPPEDSMILAVTRIAQANAFWASEEAACSHMLGVAYLVERRGGMDNLGYDGYLKFAIANCYFPNFMWFHRMPYSIRYPYGRLLPNLPMKESEWLEGLRGKQSAFLRREAQEFMSIELREILLTISVDDIELDAQVNPETTIASIVYLSQKSAQLGLRLIYAGIEDGSIPDDFERENYTLMVDSKSPQREAEDLLRFVATMHLWLKRREMTLTIRPILRCHTRVRQLLDEIDMAKTFLNKSHCPWGAQLLSWLLIMLGSSSLDQNRRYYLTLMHKHLSSLRGMDWTEVEYICRHFLWLESTCPAPCEAFWQEFMASEQDQIVLEYTANTPLYGNVALYHT